MKKEHIIKNYSDLGSTTLRKDALSIVESGLRAIDTDVILRESVRFDGSKLTIGSVSIDISLYKNIYVIGFGKTSCQAAATLESICGSAIRSGAVIGVKKTTCERIETYEGTHPLPSKKNITASQKIIDLASRASKDDLVLVVVSGGGSALLCASQEECDVGARLYEESRGKGVDIHELNIIRKHISSLKGGGLAKLLYPADVIGLIFSDVPGDKCEVIASGPTYKDKTTIDDAKRIVEEHNLGDFKFTETPKDDKYFEKIQNVLLVSNKTALDAMESKAQELGYKPIFLACDMYDKQSVAVSKFQDNSDKCSAVVAGGETEIEVEKLSGKGGRNDLLALCFLPKIKKNQVFISIASDGHDNSNSAGALVDISVLEYSQKNNLDIEKFLKNGDSFTFFERMGTLIQTGYLESNVSDLMLLLSGD